ncbi:MAG TPA: DeoR/GlpR family DNA-binding transcription regulator [Verrucomicrobiae bacterium]|nr:DeoR/GlpR family DNA-binding transcription regulator [Verrucomicrobiae bacterium]
MTSEERQKRIAEYLQKAEFASLEELANQVLASISTVRRDVIEMAANGTIRRTHGGARLLTVQSEEFAFSRRDTLQLPEKEAIGKACAELIQPGQSLIMDAGSTVYHVARHLKPEALQIITNSLPVANLFASTQQVEIIVTGGIVYPRLGVLVGPLAVAAFSDLHADVAIMSSGGITLEGISNSHALLIDIQRAMLRAAGKVIFCMDHTKFARRSVAQLCDLSEIDIIVTDSDAPADLVAELHHRGIQVIVAEKSEIPLPLSGSNREKLSEPELPLAPVAKPKPSIIQKPKPNLPLPRLRKPRPIQTKNISNPTAETSESNDRMGWD